MGAQESALGCECPGTEPALAAGLIPSASSVSYSCVLAEHAYSVRRDDSSVLSCHCQLETSPCPIRAPPAPPERHVVVGFRTRFDCGGVHSHGAPTLNLTVALDVSGSMDGALHGEDDPGATSKLEAAKAVIMGDGAEAGLLQSLGRADTFALVAFNHDAHVVQDLVPATALQDPSDAMNERLRDFVAQLSACGKADPAGALAAAGRILSTTAVPLGDDAPDPALSPPPSLQEPEPQRGAEQEGLLRRADSLYCRQLASGRPESRVLLLTDDHQLSQGHSAGACAAVRAAAELAARGVHTTFIGVQRWFSPFFKAQVRSIRGCDCHSVRSLAELRSLLVTNLRYVSAPVAYDVEVTASAESGELSMGRTFTDAGDGGPGSVLLKVASVFARPQSTLQSGTAGRVAVARLDADSAVPNQVELRYVDRLGAKHVFQAPVEEAPADGYARKAVALCRTVALLRACARDEEQKSSPSAGPETGIVDPTLCDLHFGDVSPLEPAASGSSCLDSPERRGAGRTDERESRRLLDSSHTSPRVSTDSPRPTRPGKALPTSPTPDEATPVPLTALSPHYRDQLVALVDGYLSKVQSELGDSALSEWCRVLRAAADTVPPAKIAAACDSYFTQERLVSGGVAEATAWIGGPTSPFHGKILPHHREVLRERHAVRMQEVVTSLVHDVCEQHPQWCTVGPDALEAADAVVRAQFGGPGWEAWHAKWGSLITQAVTQALHERLFNITLSSYREVAPTCGGDPTEEQIVEAAMAGLYRASPALRGTAQAEEAEHFVWKWVASVVRSTKGDCVWSAHHGRPVSVTGEPPAELANCPQQ